VSSHEYDSSGEGFEKKAHELLGEDGFEKMIDKVGGIEKSSESTSSRSPR